MLMVVFLSCTSKTGTPTTPPQDSTPPPDTAEICLGDEVDGTWSPDWNYCHQSEPLLELCGRLNWWNGDGCPTFTEAAVFYHSVSNQPDLEFFAQRCTESSGTPYDIVGYNPYPSDGETGESAIFDSSGQMVAFIDSYHLWHYFRYCCEGHGILGWSWGERIELDCTNAPTIPIDLPDTADTGGP